MNTNHQVSKFSLLDSQHSIVIVIDVQERLMPVIHDRERVVWNTARIQQAAAAFEVPVAMTEQYPRGLGHTLPSLQTEAIPVFEKTSFSAAGSAGLQDWLHLQRQQQRSQIVIVGAEAHVCVLQTAIELQHSNWSIYLIDDAVGSRRIEDKANALMRMSSGGIQIMSTESLLFEWCRDSKQEQFKLIRQLVRETDPS